MRVVFDVPPESEKALSAGCRKRSRSGGAFRRRRLEEVEQVADLTAELGWVTHQTVPVDDVVIAAAEATALEEAGLDQVGDDALDGSLGDPDVDRDISQPHFGITGDAEQDLRVVVTNVQPRGGGS